jgi:hypothetical protein
MKTFVVLSVSIVLVSILFCPLAMAAPPMPNDVKMVQPDPSLPKEIAGFWGKWEGSDPVMKLFIIVEKIGKEKANLYIWRSGILPGTEGWERIEAKVSKESGKYKLSYPNIRGSLTWFVLNGENLDGLTPGGKARLSRVP